MDREEEATRPRGAEKDVWASDRSIQKGEAFVDAEGKCRQRVEFSSMQIFWTPTKFSKGHRLSQWFLNFPAPGPLFLKILASEPIIDLLWREG